MFCELLPILVKDEPWGSFSKPNSNSKAAHVHTSEYPNLFP